MGKVSGKMTQGYDPYHLASPTVYLVKIVIFLVLVALVGAILFANIVTFFWANPFINSMIFLALFIGIFLSFRQVIRLFPEVKWVNSLQEGTTTNVRPPIRWPRSPASCASGSARRSSRPHPCARSSIRWATGSTRPRTLPAI
jgi:hypothetical protein